MAIPKKMDRVRIKGDGRTFLVLAVDAEWERFHAIDVNGRPVLRTFRFDQLASEAEAAEWDAGAMVNPACPPGWLLYKRAG